jgi:hypothetical protein
VPLASTTLGSEQPLLASELLGQGRDPLAPIKDAVTADGDVVVPIDVENFGLWLKAAFGQPTTTRTTPKTHTFLSGNWTLPSMAIETAMPEVPRYAMYTGCVCDQLSWQMARSGLLTATARLVAQGENVASTTAAGTPTSLALQRFGHFNGAISRNGTPLGNVISAEVTYSNSLDRIETIRSDGRIEGADPGMAALTGRVEVRFADTAPMVSVRGDPAIADLPDGAATEEAALLMAKALARRAILAWEGIGDADGNPIEPSLEAIDALLDLWPAFEAFQTLYVAKALLLDAEKNGSAPLPTGRSVGAKATARPAEQPVPTAPHG